MKAVTMQKKRFHVTGKSQAQGGAMLAAMQQHLIREVPGFASVVESSFYRKTVEVTDTGFSIAFVYLQDYQKPTDELDELVLAQLMIFLAKTNQLDLVCELVVNLVNSELGD